MALPSALAGPEPGVEHPVVLGESFLLGCAARSDFHSIKYDFKPASAKSCHQKALHIDGSQVAILHPWARAFPRPSSPSRPARLPRHPRAALRCRR